MLKTASDNFRPSVLRLLHLQHKHNYCSLETSSAIPSAQRSAPLEKCILSLHSVLAMNAHPPSAFCTSSDTSRLNRVRKKPIWELLWRISGSSAEWGEKIYTCDVITAVLWNQKACVGRPCYACIYLHKTTLWRPHKWRNIYRKHKGIVRECVCVFATQRHKGWNHHCDAWISDGGIYYYICTLLQRPAT